MVESATAPRLPTSVRMYRFGMPKLVQFQRLTYGACVGACLGVMNRRALGALDEIHYSSHFEDTARGALRYDDERHIRQGLADWERDALLEHFPACGTIVITGAGAGREMWGALELGFNPIGYEPHRGLRSAGNRLFERDGLPHRLRPSERDAFPAGVTADGIVVGWGSFTHIPGRARRISFLRAARAAVPAGAPLLASFWSVPRHTRYMKVVKLTATPGRLLLRGEPAELGDLLGPAFVHCFTPQEVRAECAAAGFECVTFEATPYARIVARAV